MDVLPGQSPRNQQQNGQSQRGPRHKLSCDEEYGRLRVLLLDDQSGQSLTPELRQHAAQRCRNSLVWQLLNFIFPPKHQLPGSVVRCIGFVLSLE